MRASAFFEAVAVTLASSATVALLARSWAKLEAVQLAPDTVLLCAFMASLTAIIIIFLRRSDRSMKLRLDLLFRMGYQGPFVQEIRHDTGERALYSASILRKLHDLAELNRAYRDDQLCSITSDVSPFWPTRNAQICRGRYFEMKWQRTLGMRL
jgi:hypothetical protein